MIAYTNVGHVCGRCIQTSIQNFGFPFTCDNQNMRLTTLMILKLFDGQQKNLQFSVS